tara:strand:+ start:270 stop:788 length:519 start_codon:yes stop_codon:yes gene_type:complete
MDNDPYLKIYVSGLSQDDKSTKSWWETFTNSLKNLTSWKSPDNSIKTHKNIINDFLIERQNINPGLPGELHVKVSKINLWAMVENILKIYQIPRTGTMDANPSILFVNLPSEGIDYYFYADGITDSKLNLKYITDASSKRNVKISYKDDNDHEMDNIPFNYKGYITKNNIKT